MRRYRALWIEDAACYEGLHQPTPVFRSGRYDLTTVIDASTGERRLCEDEYDAVIVDVRLDSGSRAKWRELYNRSGRSKIKARLGLQLLFALFAHEDAKVALDKPVAWAERQRVGILTVETPGFMERWIKELKLEEYQYKCKSPQMPVTTLLDLLDAVIRGRGLPVD